MKIIGSLKSPGVKWSMPFIVDARLIYLMMLAFQISTETLAETKKSDSTIRRIVLTMILRARACIARRL
jgi:hypothetical protein